MTVPDTVVIDVAAARIFLQKIISGEKLFMKIPAHEDDYDLVFSRVIDAAASAVELGERVKELERQVSTTWLDKKAAMQDAQTVHKLTDRVKALEAALDGAEKALGRAENQFRFYKNCHLESGKNEKAARNLYYEGICTEALKKLAAVRKS